MKLFSCATLIVLVTATAQAEPMRFKSVSNGGNCADCGWTIAEGEITRDTPDAFRAFLDGGEFYGGDIVFNSPGGNLGAALELGRIIRERGLATAIGRSELDYAPWYQMLEGGVCNSACAFAFLAGTARSAYQGDEDGFAPRQGTLGMHQFYTSGGQNIPTEETQKIMGQVLLYVLDMGINAEILSIASRTPPDQMHVFTRKEVEDLGAITAARTADMRLVIDPDGALAAEWRAFWSTGEPERDVQLLCRDGDWIVRTFQHQNSNSSDGQLAAMASNGIHMAVGEQTGRIAGADVLRFDELGAGTVMEVRLPVDVAEHPGKSLQVNPFAARNFWMVNAADETLPDARTLAALKRACLP